jgi:hypothetical protein
MNELNFLEAQELKRLSIKKYRDPDGFPTCRTKEGSCQFLSSIKCGTYDLCSINDEFLICSKNDIGFLQPHCKCPVWSEDDN